MSSAPLVFGIAAMSLVWTPPANGAVLCKTRSGTLKVREVCRRRETRLDLAHIAPVRQCPPDSVLVGTTCVDKYEASIWKIPVTNPALIQKVQQGTVSLADLLSAGAMQLNILINAMTPCSASLPENFPNDGNWTAVPGSTPPSPGIYAVSIPGVLPSGCVSWFQAAQACALSGKRLPTNQEWQLAAAGTPDPGTGNEVVDCNLSLLGDSTYTGERTGCKSNWGVFDMVGNVAEYVADWADKDTARDCTDWLSTTGISDGDLSCFGGPGGPGGAADFNSLPAALVRGGFTLNGTSAGVFAVFARVAPSDPVNSFGFRCAR